MDKEPAIYSAASIGDVFQSVVNEVRETYELEMRRTGDSHGSVLINAVDIELNFKSIVLSEKGWVLFGKDSTQSQMEIRIATRITPPVSPAH